MKSGKVLETIARSKNMKPLWKVRGFFSHTSWRVSDTDMYMYVDMYMCRGIGIGTGIGIGIGKGVGVGVGVGIGIWMRAYIP